MRSDVLIIDGMFCAACAASVEATIRRHPSVREVNVNFAAEAAVIERPEPADGHDLETLITRIADLGYRARTPQGADTQRTATRPDLDPAARDLTLRLIVAAFFAMWVMLPSIGLYLGAGADQPQVQWRLALAAGVLSLPVVLWSGLPFYRMAWGTVRAGAPGIDALVTIGTLGALVLSIVSLIRQDAAVYFEVAVALITLQLLARLIDLRVRRRAREAIGALLALTPTGLRLVTEAGDRDITLKAVKLGDHLRVLPGERLAVDGQLLDGHGTVDRSLLTGESEPQRVAAGDSVHAGERLLDGSIVLEVTAGAGKRRLDGLAKQVRQMLASKAPWQRLVDRLARSFLWLSLALSLAAGLFVGFTSGDAQAAGLRALAVFVIACPCALSLAAPLAGLCASQAAARRGVILRDLNAITAAAVPTHVFLDKTGTLTVGEPRVHAMHTALAVSEQTLLHSAAQAEYHSTHPLARSIVSAARTRGLGEAPVPAASDVLTAPGLGIRYTDSLGTTFHVGSARWFEELEIPTASIAAPPLRAATRVWVARDGTALGALDLIDTPRPGVETAIAALGEAGLTLTILSGDTEDAVAHLAERLGIAFVAELTPEDKVEQIEQARGGSKAVIAFVGDGLNDGPALAAADLGIAVGGATDAARAAAAITLVRDGVETLPAVLHLVRRLRTVVRRNLAWAIAYNALALPAAAMGWVHPALAASAMALSSLSIILSAASAGR